MARELNIRGDIMVRFKYCAEHGKEKITMCRYYNNINNITVGEWYSTNWSIGQHTYEICLNDYDDINDYIEAVREKVGKLLENEISNLKGTLKAVSNPRSIIIVSDK